MKNRSHRIPVLPFEDWGDGSWTVDCPCGVTFDDGEEMVDCDECGVWVHTRCSGYDKERESFTCVKCEGKKRRRPFSFADRGTDSVASASNNEETEVAELLAELPTKADPCPTLAYRQPAFQLLKTLPMDERVHVNGVPGGDPKFFDGLSSVFSSELWKCTGYVPKKFNFKYKEFPCWEDDENENPANTGADVLFSLSKETVTYTTKKTSERRSSSKLDRKSDVKSIFNTATRTSVKKERNKFRGSGACSVKQREEESSRAKDRSAKKNHKSFGDKSSQFKKQKVGTARIMNTCKLKSRVDGSTQGSKPVVQDVKTEDKKAETILEPADIHTYPEGNDIGDNLVQNSIGASSNATFKCKLEQGLTVEAVRVVQQASLDANILTHTEDAAILAKDVCHAAEISIKEDVGTNLDGLIQLNDKSDYGKLSGSSSSVAVDPEKPSHTSKEFGSITPHIQNLATLRASDIASPLGPEEVKQEEENTTINNEATGHIILPQPYAHPLVNVKHSHEDLQNHKLKGSLACDMNKPRDAENELVCARHNLADNTFEAVISVSKESEKVERGQEKLGGTVALQEDLSSSKNNPKFAEESSNLMASPPNFVMGHKLTVAVGKDSPNSEHDPPRLSNNGNYKSPGTTSSSSSAKAAPFTKRLKAVKANNSKKDNATSSTSEEEGVRMQPVRQTIKAHPKGSSSGCKLSQSSTIIQTSSYKHKISDSKANTVHPSSKTSSADNSTGSSGPGRPGPPSSLRAKSLSVQVKLSASSSSAKNDRIASISSHSQSHKKMVNHSSTGHHPSSANVTLTDEELAKRLHQELNSSPRVSRVPRGIRAGMSQFAPPTAANMLSKRSSSSGGKVQVMVSRKKNKGDAYRDGPRVTEEAQKDHLSFSAHKKQKNQVLTGSSTNRDAHKRNPDATPCRRSMQQSSSAGDDSGSAFRTLPGLIDEIMSKGRRITYEELCDAVLPHWKKLRKPNGERYAYSSHSLAVLDCLRNRNEWAHLIDRGPKTSSSRKRRLLDTDTSLEESDDGIVKIRGSTGKKEHSSREDFPKGKRNARKRRRLALQGRDLKALRKGEKLKTVSDDDFSSFSISDDEENEDLSSDDEVQRSKRRAVSSDTTSSSSDDSD